MFSVSAKPDVGGRVESDVLDVRLPAVVLLRPLLMDIRSGCIVWLCCMDIDGDAMFVDRVHMDRSTLWTISCSLSGTSVLAIDLRWNSDFAFTNLFASNGSPFKFESDWDRAILLLDC